MKKLLTFYILFLITISGVNSQDLRWAADAEGNVPYIFQDYNNVDKLIGFEIDLMNALCKIMRRNPYFVQNQWDGLIPGLQRKDYQIAMNGIEITEDREREVLFSIPYYITHLKIVVKNDNKNIINFGDLKNKKVGALKNSLAERILLSDKSITTLTYDGEYNAFEDLNNNRIEAVLADAPISIYYVGWHKNLKILDEEIGEAKYGIVIPKDNQSLKDSIDYALKTMIKSGELRRILANWNLWNSQMSDYLNDYSVIQTHPKSYNQFIKTQIVDVSWQERFYRYISFLPQIVQAAIVTLQISILSMILAIILGIILAIIRVYLPPPFSTLTIIYIETVRGTPLLIQLFFIFYALPTIGISFSPYFAAILGLGLNYAAYEAENYRAGLFAVPKGQMEAALALGMRRRQSLRYIVLPQAVKMMIPPVTNDFISLLKDSSLVSVITLVELTKLYNQLSNTYYDYIGTGIIISLVYLLLGMPFVNLSRYFERKLKSDNNQNK